VQVDQVALPVAAFTQDQLTLEKYAKDHQSAVHGCRTCSTTISLIQLACSLAVTIITGLVAGKSNDGKANIAAVVLGAVATFLAAVLKIRDYDGKASCNKDAADFYIQGKNAAAGYLKSHQLKPRDPDVLVENCTTVNLFVQPTEKPGSDYQAMREYQAQRLIASCPGRLAYI
jgi:hypothetical protein